MNLAAAVFPLGLLKENLYAVPVRTIGDLVARC
jgi:hypothetical protein